MKKLLLTTSFILNCLISDGYTSLSKMKHEVDEDLTQEQLIQKYPELADSRMSEDHEELLEIFLQLKMVYQESLNKVNSLLYKLEGYDYNLKLSDIHPIYKFSSFTVAEGKKYLFNESARYYFNINVMNKNIGDKIENNDSLITLFEDLFLRHHNYLENRQSTIKDIMRKKGSTRLEPHEFVSTNPEAVAVYNILNKIQALGTIDMFNVYSVMIYEIYNKLDKTQLTEKMKWYVENLPVLGSYLKNNIASHPDPDNSMQDLKVSWDDYIKQLKVSKSTTYNNNKKKTLLERKRKQQAEQLRIAQEQEQKKRLILENRRQRNMNNNGNNSNVSVERNNISDDVYRPYDNGQTPSEKFKIEEPKSKVKTRGQAYENPIEEQDEVKVAGEEKVSFENRYLPSRLHKKFMKFWDSSAGTTFTNLKTWAEALGVIFREDTGSSHVHAYYTDSHGDKHHMVTTNHHSYDAYGKGTTSGMKKFFIECGLTPEYVLLNKEQPKQ